ncbi:uncharacterized protein LOC135492873 isoform X2 [Lineus longissimus]|uniref:uncharacterized protein LOC135492873 isoform X2 n=1 Tax=Lineus longissimus TaxID=88925 RepID=UPI00315C5720
MEYRNLQNDAGPPYDFRGEITDDKDNAVNASKTEAPPGLSRKGDLYEPGQQWRNVSHAKPADPWDDSDAEDNVLAELRETYEKNKPRLGYNKDKETPRNKVERSSSKKSDKLKRDAVVVKKDSPRSTTGVGENDNDVVLGVPMQKMPSNQTPGSRTTSPNHLNIQVLNTKAVYEPADNLVDSYGNKRVYIFDGPVTDYYRTNLKPEVPKAKMEEVADVVEKWIYRGWREFFGILRIILSFITISLLELYKFIIGQTLMPIVIKLSDMMGGYVIKPFLSTIFNNFFQPCFVFWHNIGAGFGLVLAPIIDIFKAAAGVVTKIIGAFRLVTVTIDKRHIDHVDRIENV